MAIGDVCHTADPPSAHAPQKEVNDDHQHPAIPARSGQAPADPDGEHHPRHGPDRKTAAERRLDAARAGRAAAGQRTQAGDGRPRAAGPRPHHRDVPRGPGLPVAPLQDPRPGVLRASRRPCRDRRHRPGRHPGHLLQPQQGLLAEGLAPGDRAVLQPRPDDARLRGAHAPPPDHAGSVHPQPAHRLRRPHRPGGDGGGGRLPDRRRTVPVPPGDEGTHPRHRLGGVHGPRTRHRP